jgi:hypothetical protein
MLKCKSKRLKQTKNMSLFHRITFNPIDPYGDVREAIQAEQLEPEAIRLEEGVNEAELEQRWQKIAEDIKQDSEWFHFSDDESA